MSIYLVKSYRKGTVNCIYDLIRLFISFYHLGDKKSLETGLGTMLLTIQCNIWTKSVRKSSLQVHFCSQVSIDCLWDQNLESNLSFA